MSFQYFDSVLKCIFFSVKASICMLWSLSSIKILCIYIYWYQSGVAGILNSHFTEKRNKELGILPNIIRIIITYTQWRLGSFLTAHIANVVQGLLPYCNVPLLLHKSQQIRLVRLTISIDTEELLLRTKFRYWGTSNWWYEAWFWFTPNFK